MRRRCLRCRRLIQSGSYCAPCEPYNNARWRLLSDYVEHRDLAHCNTCGKHCPGRQGAASHIVAAALGGPDTAENLRWLCTQCNSAERGAN